MATQAHSMVASTGVSVSSNRVEPIRERPGEAMLDAFGSIPE